jgi:hypothetical protein
MNTHITKSLWTLDNFEQMGWHDCKIHAVAFGINEYEIAFDIDYIVKWISPINENGHFRFLISPATLVFKNVYDLKFDLPFADVTIDNVERENPMSPKNGAYIKELLEYDWIIDTSSGEIRFKSVGFLQYLRQEPLLVDVQSLLPAERGGISFATTSF